MTYWTRGALQTWDRTYRFAVLGMALANQFDVKEPQDLLRGLSNVLSEYELLKEEGDKPKIVRVSSPPYTSVCYTVHTPAAIIQGPRF